MAADDKHAGLASAFQEELSRGDAQTLGPPTGDVETWLAGLVARARAAYPDLPIGEVAFVRHLARAADRAGMGSTEAIGSLEIEDLYLACACTLGVMGAVAAFDKRCGPRIHATLAATVKSTDLRAEAAQEVRTILLVGGPGAPPKIATYSGRAPLDRWVAVVTRRTAMKLVGAEGAEVRARREVRLEAAVTAAQPELAYAKARYRAEFESALAAALGTLGDRECVILRLHLVRGTSVESIGRIYGVSQSTASRWLAQARDVVRAEVERLLHDKLRLAGQELASLAGLVASELDVSMSRLLRLK